MDDSASLFRQFFDNNRSVMLLIEPDTGQIIAANPAASSYYGYSLETLTTMSIDDINTLPADSLAGKRVQAVRGESLFFQFQHRIASGEIRHVESYVSPIQVHGRPLLLSIIHDITKRVEAETSLDAAHKEIRERNALLRQVLDTVSVGIFLIDLNGVISLANERMSELFGMPSSAIAGLEYVELIHPEEREIGRGKMLELLHSQIDSVDLERHYRRTDQTEFWGHLTGRRLFDRDGKSIGLVGSIADITRRKKVERELEHLAQTDALTGLANRRHFMVCAEQELRRAIRHGDSLSILMLDVDHFKKINDAHGHQTGDRVLQMLAKICRATLREIDIVGRLGGEEFAIVLSLTHGARALEVADRLRQAIADELILLANGVPLHFTASIGVATFAKPQGTMDALLLSADRALYEAKRGGRNRVCEFTETV